MMWQRLFRRMIARCGSLLVTHGVRLFRRESSLLTCGVPHEAGVAFHECAAGLRPMTPDNLPLVQRLDERILVAAGHGRSGFLLAPWTAEKIVSELAAVGVHS